jgi:hypothetical protein
MSRESSIHSPDQHSASKAEIEPCSLDVLSEAVAAKLMDAMVIDSTKRISIETSVGEIVMFPPQQDDKELEILLRQESGHSESSLACARSTNVSEVTQKVAASINFCVKALYNGEGRQIEIEPTLQIGTVKVVPRGHCFKAKA